MRHLNRLPCRAAARRWNATGFESAGVIRGMDVTPLRSMSRTMATRFYALVPATVWAATSEPSFTPLAFAAKPTPLSVTADVAGEPIEIGDDGPR
jgi:hypothetical protein